MNHLFVMDPVADINIAKDSTFAMMWEAQKRSQRVWICEEHALFFRDGEVFATMQEARLTKVQGEHAILSAPVVKSLDEMEVVWMRKDPPFHMGYILNAYLLELAEARGTLVLNGPKGLVTMNEKVWQLRFPDLIPESLLTSDMQAIRAFAEELGTIIVKPVDGNGGEGIFVVRKDDPNIGVILETSTRHGQLKILAQRYLPEIKQGDKRIIIVDGEPVGAILRVPQGVDHRGNIHVGALVTPAELTARDREICERLKPYLQQEDQVFVGIDVIGDYLTEVNVTSPTGVHELLEFDGVDAAALILDAAERRLAARGA